MSQTEVAGETDVEVGPVDYIVVEWPVGKPPDGKALPLLVDLVDRGIIHLIDLAFVRKEDDGSITRLELGDLDLDGNPELAVFHGASSGIVDDGDIEEAAGVVETGCAAALLVYENAWAAPFATALRKSGARLVATGRIPLNELIAALDELETADA